MQIKSRRLKIPMSFRNQLVKLQGRRETLRGQKLGDEQKLEECNHLLDRIFAAQSIIQTVAQKTQEELRYHIEAIVTMALEAVLPEPYTFEVAFEMKRNKTEAVCYFVRDGNRDRPMDATGGGATDIGGLALRVTMWSLGKTSPVIILDEPVKFVSRDLQKRAGLMIQELSKMLGLQFIIVSHIPEIVEGADKIIRVVLKDGVSLTSDS